MVNFKIILGLKNGKSVQKVLKDQEAKNLIGLKIGDTVKGDKIGIEGYTLEITGGSDNCGFPMRKDVAGSGRKKVFITKGVGLRDKGKGLRKRRTVCGNQIHSNISQVNLKVVKQGKGKIEIESKPEKEKQEEKPEPKPEKKEEKKPEPKKKPAEKKEQKPEKKEDKKSEPKKKPVEKKPEPKQEKKEDKKPEPKQEDDKEPKLDPELVKEFEKETGKNAVWQGRVTKNFKEWKANK